MLHKLKYLVIRNILLEIEQDNLKLVQLIPSKLIELKKYLFTMLIYLIIFFLTFFNLIDKYLLLALLMN